MLSLSQVLKLLLLLLELLVDAADTAVPASGQHVLIMLYTQTVLHVRDEVQN